MIYSPQSSAIVPPRHSSELPPQLTHLSWGWVVSFILPSQPNLVPEARGCALLLVVCLDL